MDAFGVRKDNMRVLDECTALIQMAPILPAAPEACGRRVSCSFCKDTQTLLQLKPSVGIQVTAVRVSSAAHSLASFVGPSQAALHACSAQDRIVRAKSVWKQSRFQEKQTLTDMAQ